MSDISVPFGEPGAQLTSEPGTFPSWETPFIALYTVKVTMGFGDSKGFLTYGSTSQIEGVISMVRLAMNERNVSHVEVTTELYYPRPDR